MQLSHFYLEYPELYELDHDSEGIEWIDPHSIDQSVIAFRRRGICPGEELIIVCNFTPDVLDDYKMGVPKPGIYQEVFNSDAVQFGGSGQVNATAHFSIPEKWHALAQHIKIKVPPLAIPIFKIKVKPDIIREVN